MNRFLFELAWVIVATLTITATVLSFPSNQKTLAVSCAFYVLWREIHDRVQR